MNTPRVVIVHLGRKGARGAARRLESTRELFESVGAVVDELPLLQMCPVTATDLTAPGVVAVLRGSTAVETLAWSKRRALARLDDLAADVILCTTLRAWHPTFLNLGRPVVLDFVDRLSVSYRDRASALGRRPGALVLNGIGRAMARAERHSAELPVTRVAAGYDDARALHASWAPILAHTSPRSGSPLFDLGFVGSLSYPPNVEAVQRLDGLWPELQRRRPAVTLVLAGANPGRAIRSIAKRNGWELRADFPDLDEVLGAIRISVVPLRHASGIQCKVLDAAARGVPQIVDPVSMLGFAPGFPARVVADDDELITAALELLDDQARRQALGDAGRRHIEECYSNEAWAPWARSILHLATR